MRACIYVLAALRDTRQDLERHARNLALRAVRDDALPPLPPPAPRGNGLRWGWAGWEDTSPEGYCPSDRPGPAVGEDGVAEGERRAERLDSGAGPPRVAKDNNFEPLPKWRRRLCDSEIRRAVSTGGEM